ncbi:MAG: sodium:proton antiporter [Bacteroidales bacterium]|jgi:CPA2 family monovalent cation:H+ antiporter-2|nr:sodium:proton antiporter [Bacteroidales bacterium]
MLHDLGIIMLVAGAISLLCKWLKQPVVLGYIVAGILAGPYVCGSSWVNVENAEAWGEVGVIFLLFSLGLEFSFKKLLQMGSTAFIGCLTIVVGMMSTGFMLGRLMGWNEMNALFLGGMLCMSSTTIVFKALDDLGLRQQKFAGICFGILVVEDLFAVVLMVLLASIAVKQQFDGQEMLWQVTKLAAYLLFWFVAGIMLIPTLLKKFKRFLNDETMTIVALGLCLGMVLLAKSAGFSEALGAFVMGSILAETIECERIEHLMSPIKNLFGAIFFVSVGMMIEPATLAAYWLPITIITLTVIVGQIVFASLGIVLSGQPLKVAMQSAFALTQVGEFAFIIAQFGESIGVTERYLYPVVVAVSVITTFLTPYTLRLASPAYEWVDKRMPQRVRTVLGRLQSGRNTIPQQSLLRTLLRKVGVSVAIYSIVCIFIIAFYFQFVSDVMVDGINALLPDGFGWVGRLLTLVLLLMVLGVFIYKLVTKHLLAIETRRLWSDGSYRRASLIALFAARLLLAVGIVIFCIVHYFTLTAGILIGIALAVTMAFLFSKRIHYHSSAIEGLFMSNLSAREREQERRRPVRRELEDAFLSYDLHLADFELAPESDYCGKMLMQLDLRRTCGINVVRIVRGGVYVNVPGGRERLFPHDRIVVAGSDEQIRLFQQQLASAEKEDAHGGGQRAMVSLEQLPVLPEMPFCGKTLAESRLSEKAQCVVLGIDHEGQTTMNPDASTVLREGDTLILAGETEKIRLLLPVAEPGNS